MNDKVIKVAFYGALAVIIGILAFFIMYNAYWIIGDDAIIIRHTGWGHYFHLSDFVHPEEGRFYPLAHVIYNVLPIFGLTSAAAHFALHTIVFIVFCTFSCILMRKAIGTERMNWQSYALVLSALLVCIARVYNNFIDAYSTVWVDYTLIMIWALSSYYVHTKKSIAGLIIGLISATWLTYCIEVNFIFPLSYGLLGLIFMRKNMTKVETYYIYGLIVTAVVFLGLYYFIDYIHLDKAYDGSHGTEVSLIGNAIKMFIAQKVLWLALVVVAWRAYRVLWKKEEVEFWDVMLLSGFAFFCGCATMKLNWTLYYSAASLLTVPGVVHYTNKYIGSKWAWMILLILGLFTFRKVPSYIKNNQKDRQRSSEVINVITSRYLQGESIYWFAPESAEEKSYEEEKRSWVNACLNAQLGRYLSDEDFKMSEITTFEGKRGLYILPVENDKLYDNMNDQIKEVGEVIINKSVCGMSVVEVTDNR